MPHFLELNVSSLKEQHLSYQSRLLHRHHHYETMPYLQTSRAPILAFLLVSFFLLLLLSPFHHTDLSPYSHHLPLHYLTYRSQRTLSPSFYSTQTHAPIYVLKNKKQLLCRLYHVCRLQNHQLLLPSYMKQYSRFLRNRCGLTHPFVFSSHRSLKKLNQTFNHDWIAPNTPYHQFHQYFHHQLPSFYTSPTLHVHTFHNFETNNFNVTCLLPSASPAHSVTSQCPYPPEPTIPYPAILLDHHDTRNLSDQHFTTTYHTIFKQRLEILHSETVYSSSDTICFRSMISSPPETIEPSTKDADVEISKNTDVTHLSKEETPSSFERLFKNIADRLNHAFFDESPTRKKLRLVEYSKSGRMDASNASGFKNANENRSIRKLLANKPARRKFDKGGKDVKRGIAMAEHQPVKYKTNIDALSGKRGNGQKKNGTFSEQSPTNSTVGDMGSSGEKKNGTVDEHRSTNSTANLNLLNTNNTKYNNSNHAIAHKTANRTANEVENDRLTEDPERNSFQKEPLNLEGGSFDDVDPGDNTTVDLLPTFQYLLDYNPDA